MATYKTVDSRTMIDAADRGQAGVRDAKKTQNQNSQINREQARAEGESVARTLQSDLDFKEQKRARGVQEGLQQSSFDEQKRSNRMGEAIQQDQQDIAMADKGLESAGTSRADSLRQEMARGSKQQQAQQAQVDPEEQAREQRGHEQGDKPIEFAGQRTVSPTHARQQAEGSERVTNRMNAQANLLNATRNYAQAKLKGDDDLVKREVANLQQPIIAAARIYDEGKKGDLKADQWTNIKEIVGNNPDPAVQQEVRTEQFGPALGRLMQARVATEGLRFMSVTGDMPDGKLVDMASPMMRQFTENASQMQAYLRAADVGGLLSGALNIQSLADRNTMVRKLTAQAMLKQMGTTKQAAGANLIPSQGGQRAIPAPGQQPGAPVNLKPGLTDLPAGADPNLKPNSAVQQGLREREQAGIDEQRGIDERQRSAAKRRPQEYRSGPGLRGQ